MRKLSLKQAQKLKERAYADPDRIERIKAANKNANAFNDQVLPILQEMLEDEDLDPVIRAEAAEGFAIHLGYVDRRKRKYKMALIALLPLLRHRDPNLRFWVCFALGQMRATPAIPELKRLAEEDDAMCRGWWLVKDEASDALLRIEGMEPPDRVPEGWTRADWDAR